MRYCHAKSNQTNCLHENCVPIAFTNEVVLIKFYVLKAISCRPLNIYLEAENESSINYDYTI